MPRVVSPLLPRVVTAAALAVLSSGRLPAAPDGTTAVTVSPGESDRAVELATACPTFTWGAAAGAARIELIVLATAETEKPRVVLRRELPGVAAAWTPGRAECLAPGALYAWSVRALDAAGSPLDGQDGWATPRRFTVPAAPAESEVAAALEVLRRWQVSNGTTGAREAAGGEREPGLSDRAVSVSGTSAIRGENPATTGTNYGVWGQSGSASGAGLVGVNTANGPDLILDGESAGEADAVFNQRGVSRSSASAQTFSVSNPGGGGMRLLVDGSEVSVAGHLHSGAEIASGTVADVRIAATIARDAEILPTVLAGDGIGSTLDADTLDGANSDFFARTVHVHNGDDITSGTVADARVAATLARDSEILSTVLAGDGAGSTLDADTLDGAHASAFAGAVHAHAGGDITSGTVADARVASTLTRDTEAFGLVLAADGSGSTLDADLLDGLQGQNYQRRVTGVCAEDETLQGINADGTVVCAVLNGPPTLSQLFVIGHTHSDFSAIAVGTDGLPVIASHEHAAGTLDVIKCNDPACSAGGDTGVAIDGGLSHVGDYAAIAIGDDGFPVISYFDATSSALKVAKCNDAACSGGDETITTVDDTGSVGTYTSITIRAGNPLISYRDETAGNLKVAACSNPSCSSALVTTIDSAANDVGYYSSVVFGGDALPVIAYYDQTAKALKVAKCILQNCTTGATITTVDDGVDDVGKFSRIVRGDDGLPIIAYWDYNRGALMAAKCNDTACAGGDETISVVDDPVNGVGTHISMARGADGRPVIAYLDYSADALKVARCGNADCSEATVTTVDDRANLVGYYTSVAIGTDGFPLISHLDVTMGWILVAKCHTRSCIAP